MRQKKDDAVWARFADYLASLETQKGLGKKIDVLLYYLI